MRTKPKTNTKWRTKIFQGLAQKPRPGERNKRQEKKLHRRRTVTLLGASAIPPPALFPCTSNETVISFFPL